MAIFPIIEADIKVQVGEKIRLSAVKSFISKGEAAITAVEINPDGTGYVVVTGTTYADWYLDYVYLTAGTKTTSVKITTNGAPVITSGSVVVVTEATDALFSSDDDLKKFEPDIMKWIPVDKSTWNFTHRKAQDLILTELYKSRIRAEDGTKITPAEIDDVAEVREWATYLTLSIIFNGISNAANDVFALKSVDYKNKADVFMQYSLNVLKLDFDKSGTTDSDEAMDFRTTYMVRR